MNTLFQIWSRFYCFCTQLNTKIAHLDRNKLVKKQIFRCTFHALITVIGFKFKDRLKAISCEFLMLFLIRLSCLSVNIFAIKFVLHDLFCCIWMKKKKLSIRWRRKCLLDAQTVSHGSINWKKKWKYEYVSYGFSLNGSNKLCMCSNESIVQKRMNEQICAPYVCWHYIVIAKANKWII